MSAIRTGYVMRHRNPVVLLLALGVGLLAACGEELSPADRSMPEPVAAEVPDPGPSSLEPDSVAADAAWSTDVVDSTADPDAIPPLERLRNVLRGGGVAILGTVAARRAEEESREVDIGAFGDSVSEEPIGEGSAVSATVVGNGGSYVRQGDCVNFDLVCGSWSCSWVCQLYEEWYEFCFDTDADGYAGFVGGEAHYHIARYRSFLWIGSYRNPTYWDFFVPHARFGTCVDCNDLDPTINQGESERCNGIDDNCDGSIDEGVNWSGIPLGGNCDSTDADLCTWDDHVRCDGSGNAICLDENGTQVEVCETWNADNDCDGVDDEVGPTLYWDADNDTYGRTTGERPANVCSPTGRWRSTGTDCDDTQPTVYPGAQEICDGLDNDCDPASFVDGSGESNYHDSCDSGDADWCTDDWYTCTGIRPLVCTDRGAARPEVCDGVDNDCNSNTYDGAQDGNIGDRCGDVGDVDSCADGRVSCVAGADTCVQSGPVTAFDFMVNEDAGFVVGATTYEVRDASGNNHHGDRSGTVAWNSGGQSGGGYYFPDNGYLTTSTSGMTNVEGTVAFWARPSFWTETNAPYGVFETTVGINTAGWVSIFKWWDRTYFRLMNGTNQFVDLVFDVRNGTTADDLWRSGVWDHWAFTWSRTRGRMEVYRNGSLVASRNRTTWPSTGMPSTARIGQGRGQPFYGILDDVALYGFSVSAAEAAALHSAGRITHGAGSGADPGGQNLEYCDGLDNDCNAGVSDDGEDDPRLDPGTDLSCDSPADIDACTDDSFQCSVGGIACIDDGVSHPEICNRPGPPVDDDCDGAFDERGSTITVYFDGDQDGFGDPSAPQPWSNICDPTVDDFVSLNNWDCNDADPAIKPAAPEVCDGVDNDCDRRSDGLAQTTFDGWGDLDIYTSPGGSRIACDTLYPVASASSAYCDDGLMFCRNGVEACEPSDTGSVAYADSELVPVPSGILSWDVDDRADGRWKMMGADEHYAYAISSQTWWHYQAFDPRNGWSEAFDRYAVDSGGSRVAAPFLPHAVLADGTYLYVLEWGGAWRVARIRISDGLTDLGYGTHPSPYLGGQLDDTSGRAYLGTHQSGTTQIRSYFASPFSPPAGVIDTRNTPFTNYMSLVATEGVYAFGARWSTTDTGLIRLGTGVAGTTLGANYGWLVASGTTWARTLNVFEFDGWVYEPSTWSNQVRRYRTSNAREETCDGFDNNCNGTIDEHGAGGCTTWYRDVDGDTYGVDWDTICACASSAPYVATRGGDCDDGDDAINPGANDAVAPDAANGVDNDCDGAEHCYLDADQDGYHDNVLDETGDTACTDPNHNLATDPGGDLGACDQDDLVNPGRTDVCNGIDDDCDGTVDTGYGVGVSCDADASACTDDGYSACDSAGTGSVCVDALASFTFDELRTTVAYDRSSQDHDLTVVGAMPASSAQPAVAGASGDALWFDGNDYAHWVGTEDWDYPGYEMTVAAWVYPTTNGADQYVVASTANSTWQWFLRRNSDNLTHFYIRTTTGTYYWVRSAASLPLNTWSHVAATVRANGQARLYLNGVRDSGSLATKRIPGVSAIPGTLDVGWWRYGSQYFRGGIDELVVIPAQLSDTQIAALHASGVLPPPTRTEEFCDGLDNDCTGGADNLSATAGAACDDEDSDVCDDGVYECTNDDTDVQCLTNGPRAFYDADIADASYLYNLAGGVGSGNSDMTNTGVTMSTPGGGPRLAFTGFSSSDYGWTADHATVDVLGDQITMAAWVRLASSSSGDRLILNKESSYEFAVRNNQLDCAVWTTGRGWYWISGSSTGTSSVLTPGTWYHVACTYSPDGRIRTYVDGNLELTSTYTPGTIVNRSSNLWLGRRDSGSYCVGCAIDDAGVWEIAMDSAKLNALAAGGIGTMFAGMADLGGNQELCDAVDQDCDGEVANGFMYTEPQGGAVRPIGATCDGPDVDFCRDNSFDPGDVDEGGTVACLTPVIAVCTDDPNDHDGERCDALDNDCDGAIDEGLPLVDHYRDRDGDGFGDANRTRQFCSGSIPGWIEGDRADCSDSAGGVHPGATEVCDGVDNNCSGTIDNVPPDGPCTLTDDDGVYGVCQNGTDECLPGTFTTPLDTSTALIPYRWSESMAWNVPCGDGRCSRWASYADTLPAVGLRQVTVSGSMEPGGRTCSDPATVQAIADALRTRTNGSWTCDGYNWAVVPGCSICGGGSGRVELLVSSGAISSCSCSATGAQWAVRPCVGTSNWGGIAGLTCNAPPQDMTVDFGLAAPDFGDGWVVDWLVARDWYWFLPGYTACNSRPPAPLDPGAQPRVGDTFAGQTWSEVRGLHQGGPCNSGFGMRHSTDSWRYAYAVTYAHSPSARLVDLSIGMADFYRIWVNGVEYGGDGGGGTLGRIGCHCYAADQYKIDDVPLLLGKNTIIVQTANYTGEHGFVMRFLSQHGAGDPVCAGQSPWNQCPVRDLWFGLEPEGGVNLCHAGPCYDPDGAGPGGCVEVECSGFDDDCDGAVHPRESDDDGDGQSECLGDCDDGDIDTFLGQAESCDHADNNCVGGADEGLGLGDPCAGGDGDACEDGHVMCDLATFSTICSGGAAAIYTFEGDTAPTPSTTGQAFDASGNAWHGALDYPVAIASSFSRNGRNSLHFPGIGADSTSALRFPAAASSSQDFTLSAWVYRDSAMARPGAIFSQLSPSAGNGLLLGHGWLFWNDVQLFPSPNIPADTWTHVALVYNAQTLAFFMNGALVSGPHSVSPISSWGSDVFVGQELDGSAGPPSRPGCNMVCSTDWQQAWIGWIDDVVRYRHKLSVAEIEALAGLDGAAGTVPYVDVNHEFCDWLDNDCNGVVDEPYTLGAACDGADPDLCDADATTSCAQDGRSSECDWGAWTALEFDYMADSTHFLDSSGSGHHGLHDPNEVSTVDLGGHVAADFGGVQPSYVGIDAAGVWRRTFTVAFWASIPPALTTPGGPNRTIVSRRTVLSNLLSGTATPCAGSDRGFEVTALGRVYWNCAELQIPAFTSVLGAGDTWVHLALTHDGTTIRAYVDGAARPLRSEHTGSWGTYPTLPSNVFAPIVWPSSSSHKIWLGQSGTTNEGVFFASRSFEGRLDDFVWLDYAMSTPEVQDLHSLGLPDTQINYEFCDGVDNDCDSPTVVDELYPEIGGFCSVGVGECYETGTFICNAALPSETRCSAGGFEPDPELCDGLDNDCDPATTDGADEPNFGDPCDNPADADLCTDGNMVCDGVAMVCDDDAASIIDACNGLDDDCTGTPDDPPDVTCGFGICANTVTACVGGVDNPCIPGTPEPAEHCDGIDHDCDGEAWNGFEELDGPCTVSFGICERSGTYQCSPDLLTMVCDAIPGLPDPAGELCANGLDDDCDGEVDELDVFGGLTVDRVASGDPTFDYSSCDTVSGDPPRCTAVVFTVVNSGDVEIAAGDTVTVTVDAGTPEIAGTGTLVRSVPAGGSDTFAFCWENDTEIDAAMVSVSVSDLCTAITGSASGAYDLFVCGTEVCDGGDNNLDGNIDELPDACGGDPTMECLYNPGTDEYACARMLGDDGACADGACPTGEQCVDGLCVEGCSGDEGCGSGAACVDGACVDLVWSSAAADAGDDDAGAAFEGTGDGDYRSDDGWMGCGVAPRGRPTAALLLVGILFWSRRRR